ncbi:MAG: hypothetical protein KGQ35_08355, partial [Burkholderiales bacterium]|nr:hypothetical protein [Burkholderiales bacterium]
MKNRGQDSMEINSLRSTRRHAATRRLVFHALRGGSVGVTDCCSKHARQRMAMARAQIMVAKGHV